MTKPDKPSEIEAAAARLVTVAGNVTDRICDADADASVRLAVARLAIRWALDRAARECDNCLTGDNYNCAAHIRGIK